MKEPKRFIELRNSIPSVTQKILTDKLRKLETNKIISRIVYPTISVTVKYTMIEYRVNLIPIINRLCDWTKVYAVDNNIKL